MKADCLVEENLGLVHSCAHRMSGRGIEYEELYSAGCMGLVKAARRFDEKLGFAFSTYAVPVILGEIKRLFRENNPVKVSRSLKELSLKAVRERERLSKKLCREPTLREIAEKLKLSPEEITAALTAAVPVLSLTSGEDGDTQTDVPTPGIEEQILDSVTIENLLSKLEKKDARLIRLRFFADKTQTETAKILGMTQVQVSRREKSLLLQMRKKLIC